MGAETIFDCDAIYIPCHVGEVHWALGVLNIKIKQIEYYDALPSGRHISGRKFCQVIVNFSKINKINYCFHPLFKTKKCCFYPIASHIVIIGTFFIQKFQSLSLSKHKNYLQEPFRDTYIRMTFQVLLFLRLLIY